jgi:shikimate dehydrogenase
MRYFGLIGEKLSHSFSKRYFTEKFERENIEAQYELYELAAIDELPALWGRVPLTGLNVTIPYKQAVIPYMDELSAEARAVGAVNTILFEEGKRIGYNSDVYGFRESLLRFLGEAKVDRALILGSGGAARAVQFVLREQLQFQQCVMVSRSPQNAEQLSYGQLEDLNWQEWPLVVNTTPLGMHPLTDRFPDIPYHKLRPHHFAFDLIYNPAETIFMQKAAAHGARTLNGMEMLILQAEGSWRFWN